MQWRGLRGNRTRARRGDGAVSSAIEMANGYADDVDRKKEEKESAPLHGCRLEPESGKGRK